MNPDMTVPELDEAARVAWLQFERECSDLQTLTPQRIFIVAFKFGSLWGHIRATDILAGGDQQ